MNINRLLGTKTKRNCEDEYIQFYFLGTKINICYTFENKKDYLTFFCLKLNFILGLNMFLIPIKLGTSKFSLYLILIGFLVPTKKKCF